MIGLDKETKYIAMYLFRKGQKLGLNARTPYPSSILLKSITADIVGHTVEVSM